MIECLTLNDKKIHKIRVKLILLILARSQVDTPCGNVDVCLTELSVLERRKYVPPDDDTFAKYRRVTNLQAVLDFYENLMIPTFLMDRTALPKSSSTSADYYQEVLPMTRRQLRG